MAAHALSAIAFAVVTSFVLINILVGCQSWSDPNCVTPAEFYETVTGVTE